MNLTLELRPYALPLQRPTTVDGENTTTRSGAVVVLQDADGHVGYGDLAPLPGLHEETLEDAMAWCRNLPPIAANHPLTAFRTSILSSNWGDFPTSAWFAVEAAILALEAMRNGTTPAALLSETPAPRVYVNALFVGWDEEARAAIADDRFSNYRAVKMKIGRGDERDVLRILTAGLPADTKLRLDANGYYEDPEELYETLEGVEKSRIEYIEEPLGYHWDFASVFEDLGIHTALDESLRSIARAERIHEAGVSTVVLKPSLRGGVLETISDAERATALGKQVVISSCFESGVGLRFLAQLAAAVGTPDIAHGLGTDRWLAEDTTDPPLDSRAGFVDPLDWPPVLREDLC